MSISTFLWVKEQNVLYALNASKQAVGGFLYWLVQVRRLGYKNSQKDRFWLFKGILVLLRSAHVREQQLLVTSRRLQDQ
jgi:hypothetical protein